MTTEWIQVTDVKQLKPGILAMHTTSDRPRYGVIHSVGEENTRVWANWQDSEELALVVVPQKRSQIPYSEYPTKVFIKKQKGGLVQFLERHT